MSAYLTAASRRALCFFEKWREFSLEALALLAPSCPDVPGFRQGGKWVEKTRRWKDGKGPCGIIYHYTGGDNGIASLRWGNENSLNTMSSWHATVFDRRLPKLEALHAAYPEVSDHLPVTALLHAPIIKGTWHAGWANSRCFGIENRNVGYLTERGGVWGRLRKRRAGSHHFQPLADQSRALSFGARRWESYTRGQIEANIVIGRMLYAWRGCDFDPSWVLPHSAVWWDKRDTGPAFPMEWVRNAIFSSVPLEALSWIRSWPRLAETEGGDGGEYVEPVIDMEGALEHDIFRSVETGTFDHDYQPVSSIAFDARAGTGWRDHLAAVRQNLRFLGYFVPHAEAPHDPRIMGTELRLATRIFQSSTHAKGYQAKALKVDGIPGAKSRQAITMRIRHFS